MEGFMNTNNVKEINFLFFIMVVVFLMMVGLVLCGCQGPRGYTGATGATGSTGATGPQGPAITVSTAPSTAQECPFGGTDVTVGTNTFSVCTGATGATGASGTNGTNGTVITPIQFCENFTPTYPSSFPEYGLVINGVVYGVYSQNGGFLAELPPGEYSSDGINASCNFTINANGTVSQ